MLEPIFVTITGPNYLTKRTTQAERPNGLINLIYLAVLLAVGVVTLGIGLFGA